MSRLIAELNERFGLDSGPELRAGHPALEMIATHLNTACGSCLNPTHVRPIRASPTAPAPTPYTQILHGGTVCTVRRPTKP